MKRQLLRLLPAAPRIHPCGDRREEQKEEKE